MRLIVEERRTGHPAQEESLLIEHAGMLGLPVERMTWKPFVRRRINVSARDYFDLISTRWVEMTQ